MCIRKKCITDTVGKIHYSLDCPLYRFVSFCYHISPVTEIREAVALAKRDELSGRSMLYDTQGERVEKVPIDWAATEFQKKMWLDWFAAR